MSDQPLIRADEQESRLVPLLTSWEKYNSRRDGSEAEWVLDLSHHLKNLVDNRIEHVRKWLEANTSGFKAEVPGFEELRQRFNTLSGSLKESVHLCKLRCNGCQLLCLQPQRHEGPHNCRTSHQCNHNCVYTTDHPNRTPLCSFPSVLRFFYWYRTNLHF